MDRSLINQQTHFSLISAGALWRNENHAGVKDANPVAVNQETPKLSIALNGIVLTSNDETSFVLINEGSEQKRYSLNEALESAPGTFIRKINKTSVVFETHGHYEKVTLPSGYLTSSSSLIQKVKMYSLIILSPRLYVMENRYTGFDWNPRKGLNAFTTSLLQPGDIALRINNLSLTHPDEVSQALSLLLTQQSAQFTIRRNGVPRLINVSVGELTGMNGLRHERTQ